MSDTLTRGACASWKATTAKVAPDRLKSSIMNSGSQA
jgi:hypothetical protein